MTPHSIELLLLLASIHPIAALQVTPNSPCSSECTDTSTSDASKADSSDAAPADIVCEDAKLTSTSTGVKWKSCMSCLENSTYSQGDESDQGWFLYNLRYSFDYCVFASPNGTGSGLNTCETSTACGNLQTALQYDDLNGTNSASDKFGYCGADGGSVTGSSYQTCLNCVSAGGNAHVIANSLVALAASCAQRPNSTELLGLNDTVFSTRLISETDPSASRNSSDSGTLSTAAIVGIAAGGAVILIILIIFLVRCRRRKIRANAGLSPRWGKVKDRRRSSFSFKCRNILASPLSPKFFSDLPPVGEQQPYGSLEEQMAGMSTVNRGPDGRYYIESQPGYQTAPYESSLNGIRPRNTSSSLQSTLVSDQPDDLHVPKKRGMTNKSLMTIDTTEAGLSPPPAVHQSSPQAHDAAISPSIQTRLTPTPSRIHNTNPTSTSRKPAANRTPTTSPAPTFNNRSSPKPKIATTTTTMSSQGSGYPNRGSSPALSSPSSQHGWPSARSAQEPWFPPPPGSGPATSPRNGRKVSLGAVGAARKGARESGSPVESKQIRVAFPGPPQR